MSDSIRQRPSKALTGMLFALGLGLPLLAAAATYEIKLYDSGGTVIYGGALPSVDDDGSIIFTNPRTGVSETLLDGVGIDIAALKCTVPCNPKLPAQFALDNSPKDLRIVVIGSNDWTGDPPPNTGNPKYEDLTSPQGFNVEGLRGSMRDSAGYTVTFSLTGTGEFHRAIEIKDASGNVVLAGGYSLLNVTAHPLPEPGSLALVLVGLGVGGWMLSRPGTRRRH